MVARLGCSFLSNMLFHYCALVAHDVSSVNRQLRMLPLLWVTTLGVLAWAASQPHEGEAWLRFDTWHILLVGWMVCGVVEQGKVEKVVAECFDRVFFTGEGVENGFGVGGFSAEERGALRRFLFVDRAGTRGEC